MSAPICRLVLVANKGVTIEEQFGTVDPSVTDGFGGWKVVDRPRQMGMTEWAGPAPLKASLQLLFDGFFVGTKGHSQAARIAYLKRHFIPAEGANEPPAFRVVGAYPLPTSTHWVCDGLTETDYFVRRADREPIRTFVTLQLLQYVPGDVVVKNTAARRAKSGGTKTKSYTVRAGDTLSTIAAKQLGDYRLASRIASLNGLRDPKKLKAGQRLKLPA